MNDAVLNLDTLRPAIAEIALSVAICALLLFDAFAGSARRQLTSMLTLVALAVCAWLTATVGAVQDRVVLFDGLYVADRLGVFLKLAGFLSIGSALFYSQAYLARRRIHGGGHHVVTVTPIL